jgi:hypothetical protein
MRVEDELEILVKRCQPPNINPLINYTKRYYKLTYCALLKEKKLDATSTLPPTISTPPPVLADCTIKLQPNIVTSESVEYIPPPY